jgi:hypothetical protein
LYSGDIPSMRKRYGLFQMRGRTYKLNYRHFWILICAAGLFNIHDNRAPDVARKVHGYWNVQLLLKLA